MTRDELTERISRGYERLQGLVTRADSARLSTDRVFDDWTVKDVLAHIAAWQSVMVTNLFRLERGQTFLYTGLSDAQVDELNARFHAELKDWPPEKVLADLEGSYRQLISRVRLLSDQELNVPRHFKQLRGRPLWQVIAENTFEHYEEHLPALEAWRRQLGR